MSEPVSGQPEGETGLIVRGWDRYAASWGKDRFPLLEGGTVSHLGDEWALLSPDGGGTTYGLERRELDQFTSYLALNLVEPHLPAHCAAGMEIGPGGGRMTELLLPRADRLYAVDASAEMLARLQRRFGDDQRIEYCLCDGACLPDLPPASLEFVVAFDVFVHFEPRLIFHYLRQIRRLLRPSGVAIIHYSTVDTEIGWRQFELDLPVNLHGRTNFAAFGVMCPELMRVFLTRLGFEIVAVALDTIPRDAVAVFRA